MAEDAYDGQHGLLDAFPLTTVIAASWTAQKAVFAAQGLTLIQYEGGYGSDISALADEGDFATFLEWFKETSHRSDMASVYTAMYELWEDFGTYPAKFVEASPVTRFGSWGGQRYIGDSNAVWDATMAYNGTPKPRRVVWTIGAT